MIKTNRKQILINSFTQKRMSVCINNPKKISNDDRKHGVIYQGKDKKRASKRKWSDREYHV